MIPDAPILRRTAHRSHFSDSHYNPHFLITRNAHRVREAQQSDFVGSAKFNLTEIHEGTHWLQHVGTTYGAFMDALRSSQRYTLLRFLRDLPRDRRAVIVRDRIEGGKPLIQVDPITQRPRTSDRGDQSALPMLRQIWFDHQWLHASFDDSRTTDNLGHPPASGCSEVMADVILNCCTTHQFISADFGTAGHVDARSWYFADDPAISEVILNIDQRREHLTSTSLMECAASLNELQYLQRAIYTPVISPHDQAAMLAATMKSFLESSYSLPFKLFHWQAPNHCADPIIAMVTVNLLIYLALNPPLPPRVITRPANSYRWADIYPPHRFVVALGVLNDVAPLTDPDSIDNMARYISDVADAAGLAYAGNDVLPPRTPIEPDWDQYSEQSDYPIAIDDELVIQAQLRLERISNRLPLLANYASCLAGPLAPTFAPILVASSKRFDFMGPPLEFASDAEIGFRGTREFGNNVLRSVATSHSLFELAVGSGELAITEFPLRPQEDQGLLSFMDRTLRHMIIDTENT